MSSARGIGLALLLLGLSAAAGAQTPTEDEGLRSFALAYGAYHDGLDQLAEQQLRAFVGRFPRHPKACEAWFLLGDLLGRAGRGADALAAYQKVYGELYDCSMAFDARLRAAAELRKAGDLKRAVSV